MISHVDDNNKPVMVDVGDKAITRRTAHARARLRFPESLAGQLSDGELHSKKGPVFHTAIIAGVMAAKKTHDLIPFCHPLGLDHCDIQIETDGDRTVTLDCKTRIDHKTGVEMEAMTGVSVAALTVYDMCKALSHEIVIENVRLMGKTGGKRDIRIVED